MLTACKLIDIVSVCVLISLFYFYISYYLVSTGDRCFILKITKTTMSEIAKHESGQDDYFNTDLKDFGVRVTKDSIAFMPIGAYGESLSEQARSLLKIFSAYGD